VSTWYVLPTVRSYVFYDVHIFYFWQIIWWWWWHDNLRFKP